MFGTNGGGSTSADVSATRRLADQYFDAERWDTAEIEYQRLVEEDPYNSPAWFRLALTKLKRLGKIDASTSNSENAEAAMDEQQVELLQATRSAFANAMESPSFRNESRHLLAKLETQLGNLKTAVSWLDEAVKDGYSIRGGLLSDSSFESLASVDGFQAVVAQERENAERRFSQRRNLPSVQDGR
ncbi:MAG: hypothetical protein R3C03_15575 [Pirellulaceae bacterium]